MLRCECVVYYCDVFVHVSVAPVDVLPCVIIIWYWCVRVLYDLLRVCDMSCATVFRVCAILYDYAVCVCALSMDCVLCACIVRDSVNYFVVVHVV